MVLDELSSDVYLADFIKRNVTNFDEDHTVVCATNGGGMKFTRRVLPESLAIIETCPRSARGARTKCSDWLKRMLLGATLRVMVLSLRV